MPVCDETMSVAGSIFDIFKKYFLGGVLVVVPIIITFLVLRFLFETIDGILGPYLGKLLGTYHIGLGVLATLLIILLAGLLTRNLIGSELYRIGDRLLAGLPFVRPIYGASKQLLTSITSADKTSFQQVAMIEYPRIGAYSICFITQRVTIVSYGKERVYCICFIPSTPTPVSGMTVMIPEEEVRIIDMTIEDGVKFCVSGGVVSPKVIRSGSPAPVVVDKGQSI
ncbi:MAG: DUF502 domain-containing protein [Candidatus Zixiibacteriota bacterium]